MPSLPIAGKRKKGKSSESKKRETERQEKRESGTSLADMMNDEEKIQHYLGNTVSQTPQKLKISKRNLKRKFH